MKLTDNIDGKLKGIFKISVVDAKTSAILEEEEDNNVVVIDSRTAITRAISAPTTSSTINNIKLGNDTGEYTTSTTTFYANLNPDKITRPSGSWITDGFLPGDLITVSGTTFNDNTYTVDAVSALELTLSVTDQLIDEGPTVLATVMRGTVDAPITPTASYDETDMRLVFDAPYTLGVGYPDTQSVNFTVTIIGADVMALYPLETSKLFTSAALHTGNGEVFAYKRFVKKSISELVNINISWVLTY